MDYYLTRPLPLITSRIEFVLQPVGPLQIITARTDFKTLDPPPGGDVYHLSPNDVESDIEIDDDASEMETDLDIRSRASTPTNYDNFPSTLFDNNGDRAASIPATNYNDDDFSTTSRDDDRDRVIKKVPKPAGEPGRPRSGGYTLEKEIASWGPDTIAKVNAFVRSLADKFLDTKQSYRTQKQSELSKICTVATNHYPILNKYHDQWPVRDILKLYLKNTSATYRQGKKVVKGKQKGKGQQEHSDEL